MTTSNTVSGLLLLLLALAISVVAYVRSASPTHSVVLNPAGVVDELAHLNDLVRTRYVMQEIVTLKTARESEDPQLVMVRGTVVAGVNLTHLRAADVILRGAIAQVRLPEASIVEAGLEPGQTRVWDTKISFWSEKTELNPEFDAQVEQSGTKQIRAAAVRAGILKAADETAQRAIRRVLIAAGFREVQFTVTRG